MELRTQTPIQGLGDGGGPNSDRDKLRADSLLIAHVPSSLKGLSGASLLLCQVPGYRDWSHRHGGTGLQSQYSES